VLDNERYGETGMQKTHTAFGVDLAGIAKASGFARALAVKRRSQLAGLKRLIYGRTGPIFAQIKIDADKPPLVLPPRDGVLLKNRFREAVNGLID
jgi:hypothetical protein